MTMWVIIMWVAMTMLAASIGYLASRLSLILPADLFVHWSFFKRICLCIGAVLSVGVILAVCIDVINAMVCLLYLALIWLAADIVFWFLHKFFSISVAYPYVGATAVVIAVAALSVGWYLNHCAWAAHYELTTEKQVPPLKVVMFADSHLGTTFHADGFAERLQLMQAHNPDVVFVVGDYVDDETRREDMIKATQALGKLKTKYGVYFVMGNHDKGYYNNARRGFTKQDLIDELQKAGVKVLQDETVLADGAFYIIGRQDYSIEQEGRGRRLSMDDLTAQLDKNKYMIVLDHQPADFKHQQNVDLVLSGHTHCGQLFPFNWVGEWIGANDSVYGHTQQGNANFIVTSGLSSWAIQFKTGTKSEYVVIDILPKQKK